MEEKIKRVKTPWGMRYEYRGVHIGKRYDGFSYNIEVLQWETGRKCKREARVWQLKDAPKRIDEHLSCGKYEVNIFGNLILTDEAWREQATRWVLQQRADLEQVHEKILKAVERSDYESLGRLASQAQTIKDKLGLVVREEVSA